MTTQGSGPNRFIDDMSRLMTNAMGVAQGARDEAETALKSWVDRWLADRNLVTREEFEVVREMAVKARAENAELRAMIMALSGQPATAGTAGEAPHVSSAEAPAARMSVTETPAPAPGETLHVSSVEAPPTDMGAGNKR